MASTKLVVEVHDASSLMPKDGDGFASPFIEVNFEGQRQRIQTKPKDFNPCWNKKLVFNVDDPSHLSHKTVDVVAYNDRKTDHSPPSFDGPLSSIQLCRRPMDEMTKKEEATSWGWLLEALAGFKEVGLSHLHDLIEMAPDLPDDLERKVSERVALRTLEDLFPPHNDVLVGNVP
ncbi:hypothetical protein ACFX15_012757 [Malus domestica]